MLLSRPAALCAALLLLFLAAVTAESVSEWRAVRGVLLGG